MRELTDHIVPGDSAQRPKKPRIFGMAGNQTYDGGKFIFNPEYLEVDERPKIRNVTPAKPKQIEGKNDE